VRVEEFVVALLELVSVEWAVLVMTALEGRGRRRLGRRDVVMIVGDVDVDVMRRVINVPMIVMVVSFAAIWVPSPQSPILVSHTLTSRSSISSVSLPNRFFTLPTTGTISSSFDIELMVPLPQNLRSEVV